MVSRGLRGKIVLLTGWECLWSSERCQPWHRPGRIEVGLSGSFCLTCLLSMFAHPAQITTPNNLRCAAFDQGASVFPPPISRCRGRCLKHLRPVMNGIDGSCAKAVSYTHLR